MIIGAGSQFPKNNSHCKLLLHCDGNNDETTFINSSQSSHSITSTGGACTKTSSKKFGVSSAYFDGIDDYLSFPWHDDFDFKDSDFVLSWWMNPLTISNAPSIYCNTVTNQIQRQINVIPTGELRLYIKNIDSDIESVDSGFIITTNEWHHYALLGKNGVVKFAKDGQLSANTLSLIISIDLSSSLSTIGYSGNPSNPRYYNGYIDEFIFIKGECLWTRNFTPPNRAS
jgi:hypothetical protein